MSIQIGTRVLVKDNAFGDSSDPGDVAARGKIGEVVWMGDDGRIEVQTDDDYYLLLTVDEIEEIEDGQQINTAN